MKKRWQHQSILKIYTIVFSQHLTCSFKTGSSIPQFLLLNRDSPAKEEICPFFQTP